MEEITMKKSRILISTLLVLVMLATAALSVACQADIVVSLYDGTTGEKVGEIKQKPGKISAINIEGYILDGNTLFYSAEDFAKDEAGEDVEGFVIGETELSASTSLYGNWISTGLVTGSGHTYSYAMSEFPTTWNMFVYETNTDAELLDYIVDGFYTFDYNAYKTGYELVPAMAVGQPVDVTANYVGEQWGIAEDDVNRAWKITLRSDLKWEDGTPITAQSFVNSAKRLLDPKAKNSRADDYMYSGNLVVHNAKNYLYQGSKDWFDNGHGMDISYLVKGADGKYTLGGDQVKIPLKAELEWLGETIEEAMEDYADYLGKAGYDKLVALADENGDVPVTDESIAALTEMITFSEDWGETADYVVNYMYYFHEYPVMSMENVGVIAVSDNELVLVLDQELKGFYLLYNLTSSWLVHESTYDSLASEKDGLYVNTYCTSVETTKSYGPYKLTYFQKDKNFKLEKNPYWYGYTDAKDNSALYQTTNINVTKVANASTRLQMFLAGQLDTYGLTSNDMEAYSTSDNTYYTTEPSTFFVAMNPDLEALKKEQAKTPGTNKTILTIKDFRQALSFALNRVQFALATSPTNNAAFAVYSDAIISNPESGLSYRSTEEAKDAVLAFWGLTNEVGAGKRYATKDEAIASISGYDLPGARKLFDSAYDQAIEQGLMTANDVVEIKIGLPNGTTSFYTKGYEFLVNCYTEAVKGTKLEGKLRFTKDDTLGNSFGTALRTNAVDMLFGVGFSGSALDPFSLVQCYADDDATTLRYDLSHKYKEQDLSITLNHTAADGTKYEGVYTTNIDAWVDVLSHKTMAVSLDGAEKTVQFHVSSDDYEIKTIILAAIEKAILENYNLLPLIDDSSAALKGKKINYYTEEYIYGVGRGGLKYMTYNYTDAEWAAYVSAQGGSLNYK